MSMFPDDTMVETREQFVAFVRQMEADLREGASSWENVDLPTFLEALAAWVEAMDAAYMNMKQEPPSQVNWKFFAQALAAATIYE